MRFTVHPAFGRVEVIIVLIRTLSVTERSEAEVEEFAYKGGEFGEIGGGLLA